MSAAAALQKCLELKNRTYTPVFSTTSILEKEKLDSASEGIWSEKILDIFIFSLLYILVRGLVFLSNWYSKYQYFKTKKPSSSTTHALFYSWFYCTTSGEYIIIRFSYHTLIFSYFYIESNFLALMFCIFIEAVEMSDIYQSFTELEAPRILSSTPR